MAYGRSVRRGGEGRYNRLALPDWDDPLDTSFSAAAGGRWNAPGTFPVLYLNAGERMARLQVLHRLRGQPYQPEDLDPSAQHDLVVVDVPEDDYLDCVGDDGLSAVGLPASYPRDAGGGSVGWDRCQPVGQAAWDDGSPGVACRSAVYRADRGDEELAFFDRAERQALAARDRRAFADWFLGTSEARRSP
jgi:hypothetical protein